MLDKIKAKRHAKVHKKFGKISEDAKEAVMEHENHLHPGKKHTKLKSGGALSEKKSHKRLDKMKRGGSKKGTKVNVNVITPHPGIKPVPVPVNAPMPGGNAPMPPGGGAPGGLPAGLPGSPMQPPMKKGGRLKRASGGKIPTPKLRPETGLKKLPATPGDEEDSMPDYPDAPDSVSTASSDSVRGTGSYGDEGQKKGGACYKQGGSIGEGMTAGAMSGEGRLEKIKLHRKHK